MVSGWAVAAVAAIGAGSAILVTAIEKMPSRPAPQAQTEAAVAAPITMTYWQRAVQRQIDDAARKLDIASKNRDSGQICHQAGMMIHGYLELASSLPAGSAEQRQAEADYATMSKARLKGCGF